jgi:hypothetical protein
MEELVYTVLQIVITAYEVPYYIIIDRAKVYMSKFYKSLMVKIEVN